MSFSIGIVGLPNVGKSSLFKALTNQAINIADYPFTTIKPNIGTVAVPDHRLKKIAHITQPDKITPTIIEFIDIAGLVKGASKGQGLGNQFLAQIRICNAVLQVIKIFGQEISPEQDIETIRNEFKMKDLESKETKNLFSKKPILYVLNIDNNDFNLKSAKNIQQEKKIMSIIMNLKKEEILKSSSPSLDQLIIACYNILDLITFYTITGLKETRAWTLKKGSTAIEAAGKIHSDFQEKFIKAEVCHWQKLVQADSWHNAKKNGLIKTIGKEYIVEDGDVINIKI